MKFLKTHILIICFFSLYEVSAQKVETIKFEQLQQIMQKDDAIYVFNFWATWCQPCVAEIPAFVSLAKHNPSKVKVIFVSLDFKKDLKHVEKFIKAKKMTSPVYLLTDPDYNSWIDSVSTQWSGAIPATLISQGTKKEFYEQSFDYQTLLDKVKQFF